MLSPRKNIEDHTMTILARQVQADYKKEFGEDISMEEVMAIIDVQFAIIPHATEVNAIVELPYIGKFTPYQHKHIRKNKINNRVGKDEIGLYPKKFNVGESIE